MRWQKRARLGLAIFGVAFAIIVFFAVGERVRPAEAPPPTRLDPKAIAETSGSVLQRLVGMRKDFTVACERSLYYENEDVRCLGVRIEVKARHGRDFIVTAAEASANEKSERINLSRAVRLLASDGFDVTTESAVRENAGIVRTPEPVTFRKGTTMDGSGVGMTYDEHADVLTVMDKAHVRVLDKDGRTTGEFSAGTAILARQQDTLTLERTVHALRGEQTIDADRAVAHLTETEESITALELRGNARVTGGSTAFDSMSARDIDVFYASDGTTIERVVLAGGGAIALKGKNGAAGHQMRGESLTITLAADGSVTSAVGRERTQLDLPATGDGPARHVRARNLDVSGEAGKGMTAARFSDEVEFQEEGGATGASRAARSRTLSTNLDGGAITSAVFVGQVLFEEKGLKASAAEARYEPKAGLLQLKGGQDGGGPRVSDEQINIEANAIDVTLEGRKMVASGSVKTLLRGNDKTPGLLDREQTTNVTAGSLRYDGAVGHAVYSAGAQLWQGQTAIRADEITIDQEKGNLSAIGNARSTLAFGQAPSVGRGDSIVYENASRRVTFMGTPPPKPIVPPRTAVTPRRAVPGTTTPAPGTGASDATAPAGSVTPGGTATPSGAPSVRGPVTPGAPAAAPAAAPPPADTLAQLSGPEGDLKADRIVVQLYRDENRLERLEAYDRVTLRVDRRLVTGARMTYYANGRYDMTGTVAVPVKIVESCRETTGRALTFFKSTDNIIIDGNEDIRTRTTSGGACPQPPP